ncbi:LppP/LprE family lipoprotein [Gordonia sp. NPDC003504]
MIDPSPTSRTSTRRRPRTLRRLVIACLSVTGIVAGTLGATSIGAGSAAAAPNGSGHGMCFDINSALARTSAAKVGRDVNGGTFVPYRASNNPISRGCNLDWMLVNGNGIGDATYQSRVLLFAGGRFLGTVDPKPFGYTSISGYSPYHVTVRYRWLLPQDAFCCASGGPTYVTAVQFAGNIIRWGNFPPA